MPVQVKYDAQSSKKIPVHISYEIIRLFSEGLYQSPQKAVEELVSNSYDAGASVVRVLLPDAQDSSNDDDLPPLWVVDDGVGMDGGGFELLWRVADSPKSDSRQIAGRPPIGQFGIGKLAAYVLAHQLTHVSRGEDSRIMTTTMNFRDLEGVHQYNENEPFQLDLVELTLDEAKTVLADIEQRDPLAWEMLFGADSSTTWTVAGMQDFKSLYQKLQAGRLRWVLETGLPLHSDFSIYVDKKPLIASKLSQKRIFGFSVGDAEDEASAELAATGVLELVDGGIAIPGIPGLISGEAVLYEKRITEGKSDRYSRSNGFFIRVRGRVINLDDELFGLPALNHSVWSRFSMEISADGLREHLLSSREGVRESVAMDSLRQYLANAFNMCRRKYNDWTDKQDTGLDLESLLRDAPSLFVTEPIIAGVERAVASDTPSYYVDLPIIPANEDMGEWARRFESEVADLPIAAIRFEKTGPLDRALRFDPTTRTLFMNTEHPFVDKLIASGRTKGAAAMFGSSEVLLDFLLQDHGVPMQSIINLFSDRDRSLRLLAGDQPSTAGEVLRLLHVANQNDKALERATGAAFQSLGFEYERRGGNVGGTDGVLFARLGRGIQGMEDYKLVYDAKSTSSPSVPADKIKVDSLEDFRLAESAHYGFFIAEAYAAQDDADGKLNKEIHRAVDKSIPVTLLRIGHLRQLVEIHYKYGVTLTDVRSLFDSAHTVGEVDNWLSEFRRERETEQVVPLLRLLEGIDKAKRDPKAKPNVNFVRARDDDLAEFEPERLAAVLGSVETILGKRWVEIDTSSFDVRLHHTASQIVTEFERRLRDLLGIDSIG